MAISNRRLIGHESPEIEGVDRSLVPRRHGVNRTLIAAAARRTKRADIKAMPAPLARRQGTGNGGNSDTGFLILDQLST